ncbi:MAG TPA: GNAT family N-acetyltransferase [Verrucomicrobiales bacterium]|nr:GNAT family N-acetyltransferase [Verrucomicrobiales bacterium]
MRLRETVHYLEMRSRDELRPGRAPVHLPEVKRIEPPQPELNARLYATVGRDWLWVDRLAWSHAQWLANLQQPGHESWLARHSGRTIGYFELIAHPTDGVKLDYFGLLPEFTGQGLGGWLLTRAVQIAWDRHPAPVRVWLHTSSLDSPSALKNYEARGFRKYDELTAERDFPDEAVTRWRAQRG